MTSISNIEIDNLQNNKIKLENYSSISSSSSSYSSASSTLNSKSRSRSITPNKNTYIRSSKSPSSTDSYKKSKFNGSGDSNNNNNRYRINRKRSLSYTKSNHNNQQYSSRHHHYHHQYYSKNHIDQNKSNSKHRQRSHSFTQINALKSPLEKNDNNKRILDEANLLDSNEMKRSKYDEKIEIEPVFSPLSSTTTSSSSTNLHQINEITSTITTSNSSKSKHKKSKKDDLRRSARIKSIETKKIHKKETELAQKFKKINETDEQLMNIEESESCDIDNNEKEIDYQSPTQSNLSPSSTESSTNQPLINQQNNNKQCLSPKPFKKMLLNKAFNDVENINITTINRNDYNNELTKFINENWPKFAYLQENIYLFKHKKSKCNKETKRMACDCSTSEQERSLGFIPCGDDCLNRMLMIECSSRCACENYCTNKRFQRKEYSFIIPFQTSNKGWGLRALDDIKSGAFIIEYIGEVIDVKEFKKRCEKYSKHKYEHFYFMALRNDQFIDATKKGNIARFFNHSCDPNCETQKWTVNGELRVGFFARKPIAKDEELTFDYQFQTFGEKQQKCYCGSEKCRGYLGISNSNTTNNLDYIWNETDEDEDEEEDDDNENKNDEDNSDNEIKRNEKKKQKKNYKNHDDLDLEEQIKSIRELTNKDTVLKLCRLMIRAENLENRDKILDILLNTKHDACLKLFIDYHGLKLLWSWMVDINRLTDISYYKLKLKLLDVLFKIPIKNRTIVEDCKLYSTIKRWCSDSNENHHKLHNSVSTDDLNDKNVDDQEWVKTVVMKMADNAVDRSNYNFIIQQVITKSKSLYDNWSNLQQAFKIPKKQQNEERKEHEREVTVNMNKSTVSNTNLSSSFKYDKVEQHREKGFKSGDRKYSNNEQKNDNVDKSSYYNYRNNKKNFRTFKNDEPKLSKEERRQLFEQKHKESSITVINNNLNATQTPPNTEKNVLLPNNDVTATPAVIYNSAPAPTAAANNNFKLMFDAQIGQWIQVYCAPNTQQPQYYPHQLIEPPRGFIDNNFMNDCWNNMQYFYPPPPPPPLPPQIFPTISSNLITVPIHIPPPPPPPPPSTLSQNQFSVLNLSEANIKDLKNAVEQFLPVKSESKTKESEEKTVEMPPPTTKVSKSSKKDSKSKEKRKLPANWKHARNSEGRIYYYNKITKKSQWHFPHYERQKEDLDPSPASPPLPPPKPTDEAALESDAKLVVPTSSTTTETTTITTVTAADTSTNDTFKKRRDLLREKLSKLVIKLLQPHLKDDCKFGHITNNDDFKHLARKFTHSILEKEIQRMDKVEDVELNKRIEIKTKEYVKKYMNKFNGDYVRKKDE